LSMLPKYPIFDALLGGKTYSKFIFIYYKINFLKKIIIKLISVINFYKYQRVPRDFYVSSIVC
jgi:hypothetical protein